MVDGSAADSRLPVRVSAYGPLFGLVAQARDLVCSGRGREALAAIDVYEWLARLFGDDKTVGFLIQRRMYAYRQLGHYEAATAVGEALLERHRRAGDLVAEAKTQADLAELRVLAGRFVEGMRHLARAGLLLESTTRRNDRYISALASYGDAAVASGLFEAGAWAYEELAEYNARHGVEEFYLAEVYSGLLVSWGLRLDQLGHLPEARRLLRRAAATAEGWTDAHPESIAKDDEQTLLAVRALALAKLGDVDQAIALAGPIVVRLRAGDLHWGAWAAHLALGVAFRDRGEVTEARRELLAARQLSGRSRWADGRLVVQYELAVLAAQVHGPEATGDLLETVREQARELWQQRLHRLAMLRQARRSEELEMQRARAEAALLHDPLTGLGNRRRFDHVMTVIDAGELPDPTSLLLIDVDNFKSINDTYSHSAGDQVLRGVAVIIRAQCQDEAVPIRYAGDEFTVFLRADLPTAVDVAERIRTAVASTNFNQVAARTRVTVSIGVAAMHPGMQAGDLFRAADGYLYRAKRDGRDRVAAHDRATPRRAHAHVPAAP
jgi:diguanylate cyclase